MTPPDNERTTPTPSLIIYVFSVSGWVKFPLLITASVKLSLIVGNIFKGR